MKCLKRVIITSKYQWRGVLRSYVPSAYCKCVVFGSMVMEHAKGGELLDYILKKGKLDEAETRKFMFQLVEAVSYIHSLGIVHRDLKVENFILDKRRENLKIIDFGLGNAYSKSSFCKTPCGSPQYSAPELISGKNYYGPGIDVWSLGINLFAMLTGKLPFKSDRVSHLHKLMVDKKYTMPPVSSECKDLITAFLEPEPTLRITLKEVLTHPWTMKYSSKISSKGYPDMTDVGSAHDICYDIPLHDEFIRQCMAQGMDRNSVIRSVQCNALNAESCTYNLLVTDLLESKVLFPHAKETEVSIGLHSTKTTDPTRTIARTPPEHIEQPGKERHKEVKEMAVLGNTGAEDSCTGVHVMKEPKDNGDDELGRLLEEKKRHEYGDAEIYNRIEKGVKNNDHGYFPRSRFHLQRKKHHMLAVWPKNEEDLLFPKFRLLKKTS